MRRAISAPVTAFSFAVLLAGWVSVVTPYRCAKADEPEKDVEKQAAEERKERYTRWMRNFAEETTIRLPGQNGQDDDQEQAAELVANPVFRYSDEERLIPDATLWVWTRDAKPVALQKVEGNNYGGGKQWTICFASLSEKLLSVRWQGGLQYTARTPGVTFVPIPKAEEPAKSARARTVQLKALKERFKARLGIDAQGNGGAETRTMAKAIFDYSDPESKLPVGAIFGMTSTGTNPDLLLLIEARPDADGKLRWEYAHARMTSASLRLQLDDTQVWSEENAPVTNAVFDNWTFYFLPRGFQ